MHRIYSPYPFVNIGGTRYNLALYARYHKKYKPVCDDYNNPFLKTGEQWFLVLGTTTKDIIHIPCKSETEVDDIINLIDKIVLVNAYSPPTYP